MSHVPARIRWLVVALVVGPGVALAQTADPGPLADAPRGIERGHAEYIAAFARADGVAGVRFNEDGKVLRGRSAIAGWRIKSDLGVPGT
jgi:hypothetical protein